MNACTGQPISWLRLERYALGELPDPERRDVASHLASCPTCRACSEQIWKAAAPELPPLPRRIAPAPKRAARSRNTSTVWPIWAALASAAAAILLFLQGPGLEPPSRRHVKGGDFALEIVRVDAATQLQQPTHFAPGDRFKALVTCPPNWRGVAGVSVHQAGKTYLPLPVASLERCGNREPLPGAFVIDGSARALVCASFAESDAAWRKQIEERAGDPPDGSVCAALDPAVNQPR